MVLIFPSANGYCEHILEINTNSIIKNTCAHSHVSEALLESAPYLTARVKHPVSSGCGSLFLWML